MAEYHLRPAVEQDFPAVKQLIQQAGINPMGLAWPRFIVAETESGQFAGCGQLKPHSDGSIELASIAVKPSDRNKGLGRLIIQRLLSDAKRPIYLTCRARLGSFYQKFDFRVVDGDELPPYFKRISSLIGFINTLHLTSEKILVMVLE